MIYKYNELLGKYKNRYQITKALENDELFKIEGGYYSNKNNPSEMEIINKKYREAIYTMDSAFYMHDLTDVIPTKHHLAINRKSRKISNPNVKTYFTSESFFGVGKSKMEIDNGLIVNIYDKQRKYIELIRNKNKLPYDFYKDIINNYRDIIDTIEIRKIEEYLKYFKNRENIYKIIRNEVF